MTDAQPARILVVDDTPANLDLLQKILEKDYKVHALPSGVLALSAAFANPPDLILLDIKMPGMDGYEVCARLKADPRTRAIPVIFISALQETEDKVRAFEAGGADYVCKPFQAAEVLARVRTHLDQRALQKSLMAAKEQAEESKRKAEASNRAKSAFLANMSHELRTPLNAVLGFAQLLGMDQSLSEAQQQQIRYIQHGGEFLLELINDVLDMAKIEAGRFECFPESWDTRIFFDELSEIFQIRAEQKNLFFQHESLTPLPAILYSDQRRLRQILMNLLGNAVKFTHQGGVTLRSGFADGRLQVEVADSGPGIAGHMLDKIFEPFQQAGDSSQKIQGTGLGLAIARKLADLMQGEISVTSRLGKGSVFCLTLPAQAVAAEAPVSTPQAPAVTGYRRTPDGPPLRALISDDVPGSLIVLEGMLSFLGFEVFTTKSGRECIESMDKAKADVILMDLYMPEMSGLEAVRLLRDRHYNVPIIAVTANAFSEIRHQSLAAGCNAHLTKPVYMTNLVEALGGLLPVEWVYAAPPAKKNLTCEDKQTLPPEHAGQLQQFLEKGDIMNLITLTEQLEQNGICPGLMQEIRGLAEDFKLNELRQLMFS